MQVDSDFGWAMLYANQYDEAIAQYRRVLEMEPKFWLAHWGLGLAYSQLGMFEEAIENLGEACNITEGTPRLWEPSGMRLRSAEKRTRPCRYWRICGGGAASLRPRV